MKKRHLFFAIFISASILSLSGCTVEEEKKVQAPLENVNSLIDKYTQESYSNLPSETIDNHEESTEADTTTLSAADIKDQQDNTIPTTTILQETSKEQTTSPQNVPSENVTTATNTETLGVTWTLNNGVLTISGKGDMKDNPWYSQCTSITKVIIEDGVTSIRKNAFEGCSNLTSITIPSSVETIGYKAFYKCGNLTEIDIPNSVTYIGAYAFYDCTKLSKITIPSGVSTIEVHTFTNCGMLKDVYVTANLTSIDEEAFMYSFPAIHGPSGCTGENFALSHHLTFVTE